MATFNHSHSNTTNLLSSSSISSISAISQHYERNTTATTTAFLLPSVAGGVGGGGGPVTTSTAIVAPAPTPTGHSVAPTAVTPLHLDSFVTGAPPPHFLAAAPHHQHHHTANSSSSSYTLVQIKREPCQVSEVTSATNNPHQHHHHHQHHQQHHQQHQLSSSASSSSLSSSMTTQQSLTGCSASSSSSSSGLAATSKTMAALSATTSSTSSTLTTLVKLEPPSPKVHEMDKSSTATAALTATTTNTNSAVPIGIAVARKRPQESNSSTTLGSAGAMPAMQQTLNKDLNCFGIRVADLGGVSNGCGSFYFTGNGDLMTSSTTAEEFALSAAAQSVNRAPSTFWQYPNTLPIESVISMSPATVGLQYSREASRGVVLLPATATALGISNFPLYTPTDPFQQAAAAFVWPSYIPQNTAPTALQPPPNFIFPSMGSHSTLQAPSYATPLQLFGSNYLAAAAAAAAATSTLCQHSQQQTTISAASANGLGRFMNTTTSTSTDLQKSSLLCATSGSASLASASSTSSSLSSSTTKHITNTGMTTMSLGGSHNPMAALPALPPPPTTSLILPPNAMKLEDWSPDFMALAKHSGAALHPLGAAPPAHTNTSTSSLIVPAGGPSLSVPAGPPLFGTGHPSLELGPSPGGALNLIRLPTPPSSATMESAAAAAVTPQMPPHLLFHPATSTASPTATSATPATALLNLTVSTTTAGAASARLTNGTPANATCFVGGAPAPTIGPPTPLAEELAPMNFKTDLAGQQFVFGVPRDVAGQQHGPPAPNGGPQMQDVNIQTDTPVCSEDENSSCPLAIQQQQQANGDVTSTSHSLLSQACHHNSGQASNSSDAAELPAQKDDGDDDQQPLALTKTNEGKAKDAVAGPVGAPECHRREEDKTNDAAGLSETGPPKENNNYKRAQPMGEPDTGLPPVPSASSNGLPVSNNSNSNNNNTSDSRATAIATAAQPGTAEEMTGLELLSNISTSSLVKTVPATSMPLMRIKQEPVDHSEIAHATTTRMGLEEELPQQPQQAVSAASPPPPPPPPAVEAFGGLNLLCALAEQRIQEEVQTSGLFDATGSAATTITSNGSLIKTNGDDELVAQADSPLARSFSGFPLAAAQVGGVPATAYRREHSSFPSMESIELPSTSGGLAGATTGNGLLAEPVKRKKHKHSKSSKLAVAAAGAVAPSGGCSTPTKKSQRCSKKSKKKCAKEKHSHKHSHKEAAAGSSDLDLNDEALQEDLKNALHSVDPMYAQRFGKQLDPHEIINMVETSMRMRLADVTRQYRKKKRKLDEISKNKLNKKKKKKCSKLAAAAAAAAATADQAINAAATAGPSGLTLSGVPGGSASSFTAFSNSPASAVAVTSPYLHNNSFVRFGDKSSNILARTQFPPPPTPSLLAASGGLSESGAMAADPGSEPLPAYKPVRLEPSALAAAEQSRAAAGNSSSSTAVMRLAAKHPSSEKLGSPATPAKERKLMHSNGSSRHSSGPAESSSGGLSAAGPPKMPSPMDRELILTSEHLYRKETRVLTDMGGLFYAGVMKPLQPPDIYAITLDGERGNKSHIMSREEIFKDTILEVTPKSVDSVPVGTRLCAYWSQQYRCLYPGRAIESETSEDDDAGAEKDFVSVEFDDGDSGRIRLQNIRLLLSDFPIVEYNENPLSTLGKQKKASLGAGAFRSAADQPSLGGQSLDTQHQQQHQQQQQQQLLAQPPSQMGAFSDLQQQQQQQQQQEQQNAREVYAAKRIERKRKKSLKKKSQQASAMPGVASASLSPSSAPTAAGSSNDLTCTLLAASLSGTTMNGADSAAATRTVTTTGGSSAASAGVGAELSDCGGRKHHKHKKRKKHKKQRHHRKALDSAEGGDECYTVVRSSVGGLPLAAASSSFVVGKQEMDDMDGDGDEDDEDEDEEEEEDVGPDQHNGNANSATSVGRHAAFGAGGAGGGGSAAPTAAGAMDTNPMFGKKTYTNGNGGGGGAAIKMEPTTNGVRVKTEHIDYEEETASNLMSEVSDEVKGDDEIEHNNSKGSKIAAFLPDRQLWGWLGKAYRKAGVKGRARKQFYKTIKRGKEKITVGDCAVFLSTGRPDRPYIGRIESMWETSSSNKVVRVRWFYHPEETTGCPDLKYPGALFESPHEDENDVQTISHHCEVLPFERYFGKFGSDSKQYQSIYDNNDTYYLAGYYNPRLKALKLQNDIPTLEEDTTTAAANHSNTLNTAIAATPQQAMAPAATAAATTTTISANTNRQD